MASRGQGGMGWEVRGCCHKRAIRAILAMMELFCTLTVAVLISWMWYCTIVLQGVIIGGEQVKDTWNLCIILTTAFKFTVISK